jgi:hypothetical protein
MVYEIQTFFLQIDIEEIRAVGYILPTTKIQDRQANYKDVFNHEHKNTIFHCSSNRPKTNKMLIQNQIQ